MSLVDSQSGSNACPASFTAIRKQRLPCFEAPPAANLQERQACPLWPCSSAAAVGRLG